ncbi:hypothetical protein ACQEU6_09650 [Spirillospora sp. CA-108201]
MVTEERPAGVDLSSLAQRHVDQWAPAGGRGPSIGRLARTAVRLDEDYCRAVAAYYDRAPLRGGDAGLHRRYDRLKRQNLRQFRSIVEAGIEIVPWLGEGQPYGGSRDLRESVLRTGRLHVYLTSSGHGPSPASGDHPLAGPSGVVVDGVEFCHNDLFRAVHDIFGHVMLGNGFGPMGEFLAAFCHMHTYSRDVHPILFTEQIGQICWFFYGPHLLDGAGGLPTAGEPGHLPPARRPYPEQKVFAFPVRFLDAFTSLFQSERSPDD